MSLSTGESASDPNSTTSGEVQGPQLDDVQAARIRQDMLAHHGTQDEMAYLASFVRVLQKNKVEYISKDPLFMWRASTNQELRSLVKSVQQGEKDLLCLLDHVTSGSKPTKTVIRTEWALRIGAKHREANTKAWSGPYYGETAELLRKAINSMNLGRGEEDYANFVPIVQSSGTGKSRAVDELARRVFTIPLNLRSPKDTTGFPIGDAGLLSCLNIDNQSSDRVRIRYFVFFRHLFDTIRLDIEELQSEASPKLFAKAFYDHLANKRQQLYGVVISKTSHDCDCSGALSEMDVYSKSARESAEKLITLIWNKSGSPPASKNKKPVRLVIYFDESHPLISSTPPPDDGKGYTCFQILCSVINHFKALDLFVIFLSTSPRVTLYSPPQPFWQSARGRDKETEGVQTPFNELPFDRWKEQFLLTEGEHTLEEVCSPSFMVRFGRPLFWTTYLFGDYEVQSDIVKFARLKLAGTTDDTLTKEGKLAVLGVRVGLLFDRTRQLARYTEERLIEGYMRLAFAVPKHREYICSGTSSEPLLAEAAAQLMYLNDMINGLPKILQDWCAKGLIAKGDRGELVVRLLVTKAHDIVIQKLSPCAAPPTYTTPILLTEFLIAFLGKERAQEVFNAFPDNIQDQTRFIDSPLGKAKLNFTHWCKAGDQSVVTDEAAWVGLARSLTWQCFDQQKDIDLITPLLLWDDDNKTKLGRYTVSAIFWQIKNRSKPQRVDVDAESLKFFTRYTSNDSSQQKFNSRPYLTIVLNLGATRSNRTRKKDPATSTEIAGTSERRIPTREHSNVQHPRYAISISGCSHSVYPEIIPQSEDGAYEAVLRSKELVEEHARPGKEFLTAVVQMKPLWKKGQGESGAFYQVSRPTPSRLDGAPRPKRPKRNKVTVKKFQANSDSEELDTDNTEHESEDDIGDGAKGHDTADDTAKDAGEVDEGEMDPGHGEKTRLRKRKKV